MVVLQSNSDQDPLSLSSQGFAQSHAEMCAIGEQLKARLPIADITLLPLQQTIQTSEIRARFPNGPVMACDFYINGIESGEAVTSGYVLDGIHNLDHHAPTTLMAQRVSSGNLACRLVEDAGIVPAEVPVLINHTDCDSIISSLIVRGYLPPHPEFERAVIAADHTGEAHPIADLLQALDKARDIHFSARNLAFLLCGEPLEPRAQEMLDERLAERARALALKQSGNYVQLEYVTHAFTAERISGEFIAPLFPDAVVLMLAKPMKHKAEHFEMKIRLGNGAPPGLTLSQLAIPESFDPAHGGRWNAGSNHRGGGTNILPEIYASQLNELVRKAVLSVKEAGIAPPSA